MIYAIASLCDWFGAKRVAMRLFASAPRSDYGAWWGAVGLMQTGRDEEALRLEIVRPGGRRQHEIEIRLEGIERPVRPGRRRVDPGDPCRGCSPRRIADRVGAPGWSPGIRCETLSAVLPVFLIG